MNMEDFTDTSVVFSYLLPVMMPKVRDHVWQKLPKGARFVSNAFPLTGIKEDRKENNVYLYVKK